MTTKSFNITQITNKTLLSVKFLLKVYREYQHKIFRNIHALKLSLPISLVESQKGIITIRCSTEKQKGTITVDFLQQYRLSGSQRSIDA